MVRNPALTPLNQARTDLIRLAKAISLSDPKPDKDGAAIDTYIDEFLSASIDSRASVIRQGLEISELAIDPSLAYRYSVLAARWEELRLAIDPGEYHSRRRPTLSRAGHRPTDLNREDRSTDVQRGSSRPRRHSRPDRI